jgi:hypothetical protein
MLEEDSRKMFEEASTKILTKKCWKKSPRKMLEETKKMWTKKC